jgi:beta-lactamase class C
MKIKYVVVFVGALAAAAFVFLSTSMSHPPVKIVHPKKKPASEPYLSKSDNPNIVHLLKEYEDFLKNAIKTNVAPGVAVAIIRDTTILYLKGFGLRDFTKNDSIDIHTVFRLGSVSKCFASMLTGILVDEHVLAWNDPVIKYLPRFALKSIEHTQGVTLQHVLSHTTGLPYHAFTDRVDDGANFDSLVYHLRDLELTGRPGQLYSYQNVGYSLIGEVIRSSTGKDYAENLREKIFIPLKMADASVTYEAMITNKNAAHPHRHGRDWIPVPISTTYYNVAPAGGINASIADMAFWLRAMCVNVPGILTPTTSDEIFKPLVRATTRNHNFWRWKPVRSAYYGLGWRIINFMDDTLAYHGGYVNGFRGEVAINRKDKIAICVLVNSSSELADTSIPKFFELYSARKDSIQQWEKIKRPQQVQP